MLQDGRAAPSGLNSPPRLRSYVVVTGSIAAGATTLAKTLLDKLEWTGHLEGAVELDNAFFGDAYQDFARWGFHSQVHFLVASANRHAALGAALCNPSEGSPAIVEDRTPFEHTGAYLLAYERLGRISERESALLRELTSVVEPSYLVPDLLVFRRMTTEQLAYRVGIRGRAGETTADLEVLEAIRVAFEDFVESWDRCPKLIFSHDLDLAIPDVATAVSEEIARALDGQPT